MPDEGGDERGGGLPDGADEEGAAPAPALDEDEGGGGAGDGDAAEDALDGVGGERGAGGFEEGVAVVVWEG